MFRKALFGGATLLFTDRRVSTSARRIGSCDIVDGERAIMLRARVKRRQASAARRYGALWR